MTTNPAILAILQNLCNEARDSVHKTLGLIEQHRDVQTLDHAMRQSIEMSRNSADRLLRSIEDVRDLLAGGPAMPSQTAETFNIATILAETVELLQLASGVGLGRIVPEGLPFPAIELRQDRQAVEQVLARLLAAVTRLIPAGDDAVLSVESHNNGIRLIIRPPSVRTTIDLREWLTSDFEKAVLPEDECQVSTAIAVVAAGKKLRAVGGAVEFLHDSGQGIAGLAIDVPSQPDGLAANPPRENLKILVAEDNDESFELTEILLQQESVCRARDGMEAVEMVRNHRFDCVLMDVHMPGLDGYEAIRAIRDWETQTASPRTPIVVLSSDDLETQRRSAAQSGCSGFLRKPLQDAHLADLRRSLGAARASSLT